MISLIIPFHNRKELFAPLFKSLQRIESVEVEIIFVDNLSDADTRQCIEDFSGKLNARHNCVTARIIEEHKPGAAATRNKGLDASQGEYVYFFDSDDEFTPQMLTDALTVAEKTKADIIGLKIMMIMPNGKQKVRHLIKSTNPAYQITANNFSTQSLFLRRDFAQKHARWDEGLFYWNDLEWGLRILLANPKIAWLNCVYHKIFKHPDSITGKSFSDAIDKIMLAHDTIQKDIENSACSTKSKRNLKRALNYRKALYAGHIYHEGEQEKARLVLDSTDYSVNSTCHLLKQKVLFYLSRNGIPGIWRLA